MSAATLSLLMKHGLKGDALLEVVWAVESDACKKPSSAAERQARYREKKRNNNVTSVTSPVTSPVTSQPRAGLVLINNLPSEKIDIVRKEEFTPSPQNQIQKNSRAHGTNPRALGENPRATAAEPEGFKTFWFNYPKRDGSADRKGAAKAFTAALRRTSLETILEGAGHFAEAMTVRGKTGTEFIPQARTWLNGERWNERYDSSPIFEDPKKAAARALYEKHLAPISAGGHG